MPCSYTWSAESQPSAASPAGDGLMIGLQQGLEALGWLYFTYGKAY